MDPRLREEVVRLIIALTSDNGVSLSKGLESRVSALEKTSQIHSDTILRITQGLDDANKRIIALEQSRDDLVASVSDAQLAISRLESSIGALQTVVNGLDSSVTQLGARVGQLETGLAELRVDHDNLVARVDTAERNIGSLTTELSTLTLRVTSIQADFESRISTLERTAVTSAGAPLSIRNNRMTMGLNDGLTLSGNNLAIRLPGNTGLNIQNGGLQFRFNTDQFQIVNNNLTLKTTVFDSINSRIGAIERGAGATNFSLLKQAGDVEENAAADYKDHDGDYKDHDIDYKDDDDKASVEKFVGTWKIADSHNFGEYLKAIGAPKELSDGGDATTPTLYISQKDGDKMTVKIENGPPTFLDTQVKFKLGEEFDEFPSDRRKGVKSVVNLVGEKLVYVQKWDGKETTYVREIKDGKLVVTLTMGDVVAVRSYRRATE
nr:sigmaI-UnaG [synthetic construct]